MPKKKAPVRPKPIIVNKIYPLYTIVIICVASLLALFSISSLFRNFSAHPDLPQNKPVTPVPEFAISLPPQWSRLEPESHDILFKAEKASSSSIKPTLVAILTRTTEPNKKLYTEQLLKGTQSTIPSFRILTNTVTDKNNLFMRQVTGYYLNASKRVDIMQSFYIYKDEVLTLTSSTDPKDTKALQPEIQALFDSIAAAKSFPIW